MVHLQVGVRYCMFRALKGSLLDSRFNATTNPHPNPALGKRLKAEIWLFPSGCWGDALQSPAKCASRCKPAIQLQSSTGQFSQTGCRRNQRRTQGESPKRCPGSLGSLDLAGAVCINNWHLFTPETGGGEDYSGKEGKMILCLRRYKANRFLVTNTFLRCVVFSQIEREELTQVSRPGTLYSSFNFLKRPKGQELLLSPF